MSLGPLGRSRDSSPRSVDKFLKGYYGRSPKRIALAAIAIAIAIAMAMAGISAVTASASAQPDPDNDGNAELIASVVDDARALDGSANNPLDVTLGQAGELYPRIAPANYADGVGEMVNGPSDRYLSNRIFNDLNQNIFSENGVTHWGFVWGQFLDHTIGLRELSDEELPISFDANDPLESFTNDLGTMNNTRSAIASGTGIDSPREQTNTISSYIDAWNIYGGSNERLDWLRDGVVDGDPTNNEATLINQNGYLPTAASREDVAAPPVEFAGRLRIDPTPATIAGDLRSNANIGLLAVHTLFLREHNRIVRALPDYLDEEAKFQIARRVVGALQQHITYSEFLPAMGVDLDAYSGYDSSVDPSITNEFATVGYRAHSQIHGEFESEIPLAQLDDAAIASFAAQGIETEVDEDAGVVEIAIPLNVAFANPALLPEVGLGNFLGGLSSEAAYSNDETIDNQLRSVLFQMPGPDTVNPIDCLDGEAIAECFSGVTDLGAFDVARSRDHGMPSYNDLRAAFGLAPAASFTEVTGEATEDLGGLSIDDPSIMEFVRLEDGDGNVLEPGSDEAEGETVVATRRTTTAARLAAVFADVAELDAFTGMMSEPHLAGSEFGELQLAMWSSQFKALRDGDRYFYQNDPILDQITEAFGIEHEQTLAEIIAANTAAGELPENVFLVEEPTTEPPTTTPGSDVAASVEFLTLTDGGTIPARTAHGDIRVGAFDTDIGSADGDGIERVVVVLTDTESGRRVAVRHEFRSTYDYGANLRPGRTYTVTAYARSTKSAGGGTSVTTVTVTAE